MWAAGILLLTTALLLAGMVYFEVVYE